MSTKKIIVTLIIAALPAVCFAQPTIHHLEDFSIGTVLKFSKCIADDVPSGEAGPNMFWDYSHLVPMHDTVTEWMVKLASTPAGNLFPTANLVEKYSDGRFVYINKLTKENYLEGYADVTSKVTIQYPDGILFLRRPMTYLMNFSSSYRDTFTAAAYHFLGSGKYVVTADGYGTLKLPNGTYQNVLRIKIEQQQTDTLLEFGTTSVTKSYTYAWFDDMHRSALQKITLTQGGSFTRKSVEYLIKEQ